MQERILPVGTSQQLVTEWMGLWANKRGFSGRNLDAKWNELWPRVGRDRVLHVGYQNMRG